MRSSFTLLNFIFNLFESAATLLMAPLTLVTAAALIAATALVNRQLRNTPGRGMDGPRIWDRKYQEGA